MANRALARAACVVVGVVGLAACAEDTADTADGAGATGTATTTPKDPALTPEVCPNAPTNLELGDIAPFWGGLVQLEMDVNGPTPFAVDVQSLDPSTLLWGGSGVAQQREDGKYVANVTPSVNTASKDLPFRLRTRSRLDGCPLSDWAESEPFELGDPLAGTTWTGLFEEDVANMYLNVYGATSTGEYVFDPEPTHVIEFHEDGTLAETVTFGIASDNPSDPYDGCTFSVHLESTWEIDLANYNQRIHVAPRAVRATDPLQGSSCSDPPLADIDLAQDEDFQIDGGDEYFDIDYSELLWVAPGTAYLDTDLSDLSTLVDGLSDNTGTETWSVSGYLTGYSVKYEETR